MRNGLRTPAVEIAAIGTIVVLWAAAVWSSWLFRGLYADGSDVLLGMLGDPWFSVGLLHPRAYAVILVEAPTVLALRMGVTDLRWLSRIFSFGLFALPTAIYTLALLRARRDAFVLATTIAALTIVFMTTSFHIGCETGPGYAAAILAAVWLVTAPRLTTADGIGFALIAALSSRLYEHYVYLGPLLALMTAWAVARSPTRPRTATFLCGVAIAFFLLGTIVAAQSLYAYTATEDDRRYLNDTIDTVWSFRFNLQLDVFLAMAALMLTWGLARPADFDRPWPYLVLGAPTLLVALSPLLVVAERFVAPPYSWTQQASRTAAGPMAAATILFLWFYASRRGSELPFFVALKRPQAARSFLLLVSAMFLAMLPWNAMTTVLYARYLGLVREVIRAGGGVVESDRTLLVLHPRLAHHDFAISSLSLIMRGSPGDGIIVSPPDLISKNTIDPDKPPDLGPYRWRDPR